MFLFDLKWKRRELIVFRLVCKPELEPFNYFEILKDICWGVNIIFCISYVVFRTTNFGWGSGEGSVTIVSTFSCTSLSWEWDCRAAAASQRLYGLDHIDSHFYTWRNYPYKGQMKEKGAKNWESMVFLSDHMSEWFQVSKVILCVQILLQSVTDWRRRRPRVGAELAGFCYIIRHHLKPPRVSEPASLFFL